MKSLLLVALFATISLTSCVVTPDYYGQGGVVVSPLPAVVELGSDPYYYQDGYYYFYQNNNWRYSKSRSGPWTDLPRSHWPKEVRHKDGDHDRDRGRDYDRNRYDNRDRDYRNGHDRY